MKKLICLLLCLFTVAFAGCDAPSEKMVEEDIRKTIVADNMCLTETEDTAGGIWLNTYLKVENAQLSESFRTAEMSKGFSLCFSKWDAGQSKYIVSEVVKDNGERYLCDLYELTGVKELHSLEYAFGRIKEDERFASGMMGIGSNAFSEGVMQINITDAAPQTRDNTLLVKESIAERKVMYGKYSEGSGYTVKLVVTVDGNGIRSTYMCNDDRTAMDGKYLLNKTYYIGYSETTGDLVLIDRLYEETVISDTVDSADETRRIPELFGVWEDRVAIYYVSDNTGVCTVGMYDALKKTKAERSSTGKPIGIYGNRLYLSKTGEDGSCAVAYILIDQPNEEPVLFDCGEGVIENVAFSEDGRMAVVYAPVDGMTTVCVYNAATGELTDTKHIGGVYCSPKYAGFLDDGSLMILCDKKLLCDDYMFIIGR